MCNTGPELDLEANLRVGLEIDLETDLEYDFQSQRHLVRKYGTIV
jgi:hypothetical protein